MKKFLLTFFLPCVYVGLFLSGCKVSEETSGGDSLPTGFEFNLPDDIEVVSIELNSDKDVDLGSDEVGLSVTITLSESVPEDIGYIIPFVVRDVELIGGKPLCAGFIGMTSADGIDASRDNIFELVCDDGEVAGRAISSSYGMDDYDDSSGERSTSIYVQHLEGIKSFLGLTVGVKGVKSNKIKATCPK